MILRNTYFIFFFAILFSSCTLIPSKEWLASDKLDSNIEIKDIQGRYLITNNALKKLQKYFNEAQIDSLKTSYILISKDSTIIGENLPLNLTFGSDYKVSSGKRKIHILRNNHEKFRFIPRPDNKPPKMHFRIKNGRKGILVNLSLDPDATDYYEYILKEDNE